MMSESTLLTILVPFIVLVFYVFYLIHLMKLLAEISETNRHIHPNNVFLMLIPVFNIIYRFFMYPKISESIRLECKTKNIHSNGDSLNGLGLTLSILGLFLGVTYPFKSNQLLGPISSLFLIATLVIWIIYWAKSGEFRSKFREERDLLE